MAPAVLLLVLLGVAADAAAQRAVPPPEIVHGRVLTDEGVPLRGARVVAITPSEAAEPSYSDQDGRFRLAVTGRDAARLRISKAGYAPQEVTVSAPGRPLDMHLTRGAVLAGQVSDRIGRPAAGVFVLIRSAACTPPCRAPEITPPPSATAGRAGRRAVDTPAIPTSLVAETDDRGQFRFGSLPADPTVVLEPASVLATPRAAVTLRAGEEATVRLTFAGDSVEAFVTETLAQATSPQATADVDVPRTGQVRGEIRAPDRRPAGGAIVVLEHAGGGTVQVARADARGRYVLAGLPPGRFRLTVFTAGLPAAELGQRRALQPGRTLVLRAGDTIDDVDIEIPRGHVISGRVVDAYNEPIEHLTVQAWQQRFVEGQLVLEPALARVDRTDDRGQYRIHGLLPGTYYIVAYDASVDSPSSRVGISPGVSPRAPAGAGRGNRGTGGGRAIQGSAPAAVLSAPYVPPQAPLTYYPGQPFLADALPVRIRQGMDPAGIDFVFTPTRGARLDGRVLDGRGQPVQAAVTLVARRGAGASGPPVRVARTGPDGTFLFAHVPPGDYVLQAATGRMAACRAVPAQAPACGAVTGSTWEFGTTPVHISGVDSISATVWTSRGSVLSGRVILEGGERWSLPPSGFTLVAVPAAGDGAPAGIQPRAVVGADGRFTMADLAGTVRITAVDVPQGWYLTSVRIDGIDALDRPLTFGPPGGTRSGVEVTFSTRGAEIHGRVVDAGRRPVAHAAVVVYPADASRWHDWPRAMAATASGPDGHFVLTALPPGDYLLAAVAPADDTIDDDWRNPEILHRLTPGAQRITLRPGERAATDVRPIR